MIIGLFGGAFDPPHIGHKQVADYLVQESVVDEVWFVPVYKHPWADRYGKQTMAPYEDRVAMLELLCGDRQRVMHYKDVGFTYDTLVYFSAKYPDHVFKWVMGSEYLDRWDDFLATHPKLSDFEILVYPRAGHALEPLRENMTALPEAPEVQASSSNVRKLIVSGVNASNQLHVSTRKFLTEKKLYLK